MAFDIVGAIAVELVLDRQKFDRSLAELQQIRAPQLEIRTTVDHKELFRLNQHLEQKRQHATEINRWFQSNPIKPRVNDAALSQLNRRLDELKSRQEIVVDVKGDLSALRSQLASFKGEVSAALSQNASINIDTSQIEDSLSKSIERAFNKSKGGGLGSALSGIISAPLKLAAGAVTDVGGQIASGLIQGATFRISQQFGDGISAAIEQAVSTRFGSTELIGEKFGGGIISGINKSFTGIGQAFDQIPKALEQAIDQIPSAKIRAELKKKLLDAQELKQSLSQGIQSSLQQAFPEQEVLQEGLATRGRRTTTRTARRQAAQEQSLQEYRDAANRAEDVEAANNTTRVEAQIKRQQEIVQRAGSTLSTAQQKIQSTTGLTAPEFIQQVAPVVQQRNKQQFESSVNTENIKNTTARINEINQQLAALRSQGGTANQEQQQDLQLRLEEEGRNLKELQQQRALLLNEVAKYNTQLEVFGDPQTIADVVKQYDALQADFVQANANLQKLQAQRQKQLDAIQKAQAAKAKASQNFETVAPNQIPQNLLDVLQSTLGDRFDPNNLPQVRYYDTVTSGRTGKEALGVYSPSRNVVKLGSQMRQAIESNRRLTEEEFMQIAEEFAHSEDFGMGSYQGFQAARQNRVLPGRQVKATPEELMRVAPELALYSPERREVELNAKVKAMRGYQQYQQTLKERENLDVVSNAALSNMAVTFNADKVRGKADVIQRLGDEIGQDVSSVVSTIESVFSRIEESARALSSNLNAYIKEFGLLGADTAELKRMQAQSQQNYSDYRKVTDLATQRGVAMLPTAEVIRDQTRDFGLGKGYIPQRLNVPITVSDEFLDPTRDPFTGEKLRSDPNKYRITQRKVGDRVQYEASTDEDYIASQLQAKTLEAYNLLKTEVGKSLQEVNRLLALTKDLPQSENVQRIANVLEKQKGSLESISQIAGAQKGKISITAQTDTSEVLAIGKRYQGLVNTLEKVENQVKVAARAIQGVDQEESFNQLLKVLPLLKKGQVKELAGEFGIDAKRLNKNQAIESLLQVEDLPALRRRALEVSRNAGQQQLARQERFQDVAESAGNAARAGLQLGKQAISTTGGLLSGAIQSEAGQAILSAATGTARGLAVATKATYALASGLEAVALDIVPAGRTLKGVLRQTVVPAGLFLGASALVPGGGLAAGALSSGVAGLLGPVGGVLGAQAGGAAAGAIGSVLPSTFGIAGSVSAAVGTAISTAITSATPAIATGLTAVIGGKVIENTIGKGINAAAGGISPTVRRQSLPSAESRQQPLQLPFTPQRESELIAVEARPSQSRIYLPGAPNTEKDRAFFATTTEKVSNTARRAGEVTRDVVASVQRTQQEIDQAIANYRQIVGNFRSAYENLQKFVKAGDTERAQVLAQTIQDAAPRAQEAIKSLRSTLSPEQLKEGNLGARLASQMGEISRKANLSQSQVRKMKPSDIPTDALDVEYERLNLNEGIARLAGIEPRDTLPRTIRSSFGSERVKDLLVNSAGLGASVLASRGGPVAGIAGDLLGALAMRQAIGGGGKALSGDLMGFAVGNLTNAFTGIPGSGAAAASAIVPQLQKMMERFRGASVREPALDVEFERLGFGNTGKQLQDARRKLLNGISRFLEKEIGAIDSYLQGGDEVGANRQAVRSLTKLNKVFEGVLKRRSDIVDDIFQSEMNAMNDQLLAINAWVGNRMASRPDSDLLFQRATSNQLQRDVNEGRVRISDENRSAARMTNRLVRQGIVEDQLPLNVTADKQTGFWRSIVGPFVREYEEFQSQVRTALIERSRVLLIEAKSLLNEVSGTKQSLIAQGASKEDIAPLAAIEKRLQPTARRADAILGKNRTDINDEDLKKLREFEKATRDAFKQVDRPLPSNALKDGFSKIAEGAGAAIASIQKFSGLITTVVGGFIGFQVLSPVTQQLFQFGKGAVDAAINLDRLKTGLSFASGGSARAGQDFDFIRKTVSDLGVPLDSAQKGFVRLAAATRGTAVQGQATRDVFLGIQQATTTLGLSSEDASGALLAISQIASKGKVSAEELRQQLGERLPGAMAIAARSMGLTEAEFNKLLETGGILAEDFLPKFGRQLQQEFGGAAQTASRNLQSSFFRLGSAATTLQEKFGQAISPAVKTGVDALGVALNLLANNMDKIIGFATLLAGVFAGKLLIQFVEFAKYNGIFTNMLQGIVGLAGGIQGTLAKAFEGITFSAEGASIAAGKLAAGIKGIFATTAPLLVVAGILEGIRAIGEANSLSDTGKEFANSASSIEKAFLQAGAAADIAANKFDNAAKKLPKRKDLGSDLTLGLGGLTGLAPEGIKTDSLIRGIQNLPKPFQRGITTALDATGIGLLGQAAGILPRDENGNITTVADRRFQGDLEQANRFKTSARDAAVALSTGKITGPLGGEIDITQSLQDVAAKDRRLQQLRNDRARLAATGTAGQGELRNIDNQIREEEQNRAKLSAPLEQFQGGLTVGLQEAKKQIDNIQELQKAGKISGEDAKALSTPYEQTVRTIEAMQKRLDGFNKGVDTSTNLSAKLSAKFADIADRIAAAKAQAELLAGKTFVATFGTDQLAGQKAALTRARAERESSELGVREIRQELTSAAGKELLAQVPVGSTGRAITVDSSLADVERASKTSGLNTKQKDAIEQVKKLRELEITQVTAAQNEVQAREALATGELDLNAQQRDSRVRQLESSDRRKLAIQQRGNRLPETEVAVKNAQINLNTTNDQITATETALEELKNKAGLTAAERIKRETELTTRLSDLKKQQAEQELALQESINKRIVDNLQRANRLAEASIQRTSTERITTLKRFGLEPGAGELTDQAIARASSATETVALRERIAIKEREIRQNAELTKLGTISAREGQDNEIKLQQELADLNQQRVDRAVELERQLRDARLKYLQETEKAQENSINREIELLKARNELAKAQSDAKISGLEGQLKSTDRAISLTDRLKTEADPGVRAEIQRQLAEFGSDSGLSLQSAAGVRPTRPGARTLDELQSQFGPGATSLDALQNQFGPGARSLDELQKQFGPGTERKDQTPETDALKLLERKFEIEDQIAAQRIQASQTEYETQLKILDLELKKNLAGAEREAREARLAQKQAELGEKVAASELSEAKKSGDKERISIAEKGAEIAKDEKDIAGLRVKDAAENIKQVKELGQAQKDILNTKRQQEVADQVQAQKTRKGDQRITLAEEKAGTRSRSGGGGGGGLGGGQKDPNDVGEFVVNLYEQQTTSISEVFRTKIKEAFLAAKGNGDQFSRDLFKLMQERTQQALQLINGQSVLQLSGGRGVNNVQDFLKAREDVSNLLKTTKDAGGNEKAGELILKAANLLQNSFNDVKSSAKVTASGGTVFQSELAGELARNLDQEKAKIAFDLAEALKGGKISKAQIFSIESGAKSDTELLAALKELVASIRQNSDAQEKSRAQALAGIGNLPAFETGGAVGAHLTNKPILVGEKGPEIFWPPGPGYVMPHHLSRFLMDPGLKRYETGGLVGGAIMPIVPDVSSPAKVEPSAAPNNAMDRLSSEFAQHVNRLASAAEKLVAMPVGQNNSFTLVNESDPIDSILRLQHGLMRTQYGV